MNVFVKKGDNGRFLDYSHTNKNGTKTPTNYPHDTSPLARNLVMGAIDHHNTVIFEVNRKGNLQLQTGTIVFDGNVIEELMYNLANNSHLNPKTTGYGMIAYHELNHWLAGANANDPTSNSNSIWRGMTNAGVASSLPGPTVGLMNNIRQELTNARQGDYGLRSGYFMVVGRLKVITFSTLSRNQIMGTGNLNGVLDYTFIPITPGQTPTDGQKDYGR